MTPAARHAEVVASDIACTRAVAAEIALRRLLAEQHADIAAEQAGELSLSETRLLARMVARGE